MKQIGIVRWEKRPWKICARKVENYTRNPGVCEKLSHARTNDPEYGITKTHQRERHCSERKKHTSMAKPWLNVDGQLQGGRERERELLSKTRTRYGSAAIERQDRDLRQKLHGHAFKERKGPLSKQESCELSLISFKNPRSI